MLLKGAPVAQHILDGCDKNATMAVVSVGHDSSNDSYLKGIQKTGVNVDYIELPEDITNDELQNKLDSITADGILLFKPLPKGLDPQVPKDLDGLPCTAEACIKILDFYNIEIAGKDVCVVGRSPVVGRPVAQMLIDRNATVTVCHSKTKDIDAHIKRADIVIVATGTPRKFKEFSPGQVVVDAGINWDGKLCGDVDFEAAEPVVDSITPVPGGVGPVTTAVLIEHLSQMYQACHE